MKKRLKIGLFIDTFYPAIDGVVIAVDNLALELSKYNDVVVVAPNSGEYDDIKPYKIYRINGLKVPSSEYIFINKKTQFSKHYKKLLKERFDVIHIHSPFNIGKLGIKIAKDLNIPCICTVHTRFNFEVERIAKSKKISNIATKVILRPYNQCDKCIVVNDPLIEEIKNFGYKYDPVVIYNGTDLKKCSSRKLRAEIIEKYNLKDEKNILIFVGRIISIKNIFFILDSLKLLKDKNYDFKMLFVGTGPEENELKNKIKKYKLENEIIMTGKITDRKTLACLYDISNLLLFPSLMDTSSLVRIEAAINKTPGLFISESMVGVTIKNNVNGFTCSLDNEKYTNRIIEILENRRLLNRVSRSAKRTLSKTWRKVAKETYNLYLKMIEEKESENE